MTHLQLSELTRTPELTQPRIIEDVGDFTTCLHWSRVFSHSEPTFDSEIWWTTEIQAAKALAYHQLRGFGIPLGAHMSTATSSKKTGSTNGAFLPLSSSQPWVLVNFAISYRFLSAKITRGVMKWFCAILQMPRSCRVSALDSPGPLKVWNIRALRKVTFRIQLWNNVGMTLVVSKMAGQWTQKITNCLAVFVVVVTCGDNDISFEYRLVASEPQHRWSAPSHWHWHAR